MSRVRIGSPSAQRIQSHFDPRQEDASSVPELFGLGDQEPGARRGSSMGYVGSAIKRSIVPEALFAGLAATSLVALGWFTLEVALLHEGKPPITWYVRNKVSWHPWVTGLASFSVGAVA